MINDDDNDGGDENININFWHALCALLCLLHFGLTEGSVMST